MANATPSRLGFKDGASDGSFAQDNALFLVVFGGEVLAAFRETNVMESRSMVRTIEHGKSASFPAMGKTTAGYHTPGNEITGNVINANERVISIDSLLLSSTFIANIDEAKNHYDVRSEYSFQMGASLAIQMDKNLLQLAVLAARSAATVSGGNGGSALTLATYGTVSADLISGIQAAQQKFDEKDVPGEGRQVALKPAQYWLLASNTTVYNRDWAGAGSYAEGEVLKVAGTEIVKTNHLPTTNIAAVTGQNNTYSGNFSTTVAVAWHKSAIGTVKLMDLSVESEYDIRRQGTLMVARYAVGHGVLRPEASVELKSA